MSSAAEELQIVETDSRNRVSLSSVANRRRRYVIHASADGTITLEPAVVLTELERAYLANSEVQAVVETGRANPQDRRKWTPRRPRPHQQEPPTGEE